MDIGGCVAVSDIGFAEFMNLRSLRRLQVPWCLKVSHKGLNILSTLIGLQGLNTSGCQLISEEGICLIYPNDIFGISRQCVSDRALEVLGAFFGGWMHLHSTFVTD